LFTSSVIFGYCNGETIPISGGVEVKKPYAHTYIFLLTDVVVGLQLPVPSTDAEHETEAQLQEFIRTYCWVSTEEESEGLTMAKDPSTGSGVSSLHCPSNGSDWDVVEQSPSLPPTPDINAVQGEDFELSSAVVDALLAKTRMNHHCPQQGISSDEIAAVQESLAQRDHNAEEYVRKGVDGEWRPGSENTKCQACQRAFGLMRIRHQCSACNGHFCHQCAPYWTTLHSRITRGHEDETLHRLCAFCYDRWPKYSLAKLPLDCMTLIWTYLPLSGVGPAKAVSRLWQNLLEEESLWAVFWARDYPGEDINTAARRVSQRERPGLRVDDRTVQDKYRMVTSRRYVEIPFGERSAPQKAGIVCLSVVVAPAVVVYKSPQILVAAAKGTLRALAAGSEIGYEYALVPAANGVYQYVLVPAGVGLDFTAKGLGYTARVTAHGIKSAGSATHRHVLVPTGHGMTAAARAMVHGAQVVGQKTAEGATTASYATIEAGVRTSRFLEDYVVDPTARGVAAGSRATWNYVIVPTGHAVEAAARGLYRGSTAAALAVNEHLLTPAATGRKNYVLIPIGEGILSSLKFICVTMPHLIYEHALTPLAVGMRAVVTSMYTNVITPMGQGIYRFGLVPLARGIKACVTTTFTQILPFVGRCTYRHILVPFARSVKLLCQAYTASALCLSQGERKPTSQHLSPKICHL
jgi:hypothetical protein